MAGQRNIPVTLDQVFRQIQGKIVADGLAPIEMVFASDSEDQPPPPSASFYISIVLGAQIPDERTFTGAGRIVLMFTATVMTFVWTRLGMNVEGRDTAQISDTILGSFEKERRLINSLDEFDPVNNNGDYYFCEPMRMAAPGFHLQPRSTVSGWNGLGSTWTLMYILDATDFIPPT